MVEKIEKKAPFVFQKIHFFVIFRQVNNYMTSNHMHLYASNDQPNKNFMMLNRKTSLFSGTLPWNTL